MIHITRVTFTIVIHDASEEASSRDVCEVATTVGRCTCGWVSCADISRLRIVF